MGLIDANLFKMRERLGRNSPCWCGSGRKYKLCHLGRENDDRPHISESIKAFRSVQTRQVCLHPDAPGGECHGGIVKAHTVQMELLRKIARNGHVYGFAMDFGAYVSSQGFPPPRLMGIGRASTFTGFCAKHDDQLFADIEKGPIQSTERHACLIAYRALCVELFAKEGAVLLDQHLSEMDRGLSVPGQIALQEQNAGRKIGLSIVLKEIRGRKQRYDEILKEEDFTNVRYCVIWLEQPPDIMCSSCTNPKWDFAGKRIQNLADLNTPAQAVAASLLASRQHGCVFFSWLAEDEGACTKLVGSLLGLPRDRIPDAIVRFVLSSFENQFWRPDWWEALAGEAQDALIQRFHDAINPFTLVRPNYLCEDRWSVVDWQMTRVETNVEQLADLAQAIGLN